jgi:hypothetical protein
MQLVLEVSKFVDSGQQALPSCFGPIRISLRCELFGLKYCNICNMLP